MRATIRIINSYFWKSISGPLVLFGFSSVWIILNVSVWNIMNEVNPVAMLPTAYCTIICLAGMISVPMTINDLKASIVLKRIGQSYVQPWMFLAAIISYYMFMTLIGYIFEILVSFLVLIQYFSDFKLMILGANYGSLFYNFFIFFLMSALIGTTLSTFCKTNFQIQMIGAIVLIVSMVLACFCVPITLVHVNSYSTNSLMGTAVYINPFWYGSSFNYEAWFGVPSYFNRNGSNPFNISTELFSKLIVEDVYPVRILSKVDKMLNIFVPLSLISVLGCINIYTFKMNQR